MIIKKVLFISLLLISAGFFFSCSSTKKVNTSENYDMVDLPDGSVAYLNHNSSISFSKDFNPRRVEMTGEVFFSVVHDDTPFVVHLDDAEIKVLGTEFNVKEDKEEVDVEVSEGTVELDSKGEKQKVNSGEKARLFKGENRIKKGKAEKEFELWMKGLEVEFKKMGKEIKKGSKELGKETKKIGKDLKKEINKLKK